ncbi:MAG: SIMPL domain-containing protein [Methanolinea sp.]|nr:SIMPL domain-containing protein [Methanolinea sp.]
MNTRISREAILLLTLAILAWALAGVASAAENSERTISATGNAEITVTPDRAMVTVSVVTENANALAAQNENARVMDSVVRSLEAMGIEKKDLKTTGYSIYPIYDDSKVPFGQKVKYYRVTNSLRVTIRDVPRTGEVIDSAVNAGANQVDSITFMVSEELESSLRADVLSKAVNKAFSDASAVAGAAGVTIRGVKEISVGAYYPPVLYENVRASAVDMKSAPVPTPIEPGEVKITASVSVVYLIG